ncbi:hypothetical protein M9Y10_044850 [Tritrichomonas musculus]|uniref:Uncharacterized protein n=1 Tax=Tritrichomonas musculus TaxID=1915356 RepID=A0ABR2JTJ7_9EUKA
MLSEEALKQLSQKGPDFSYNFDLSTIDANFYEPLFRKLQRFAINNVTSLGFNCSQLSKYEETRKRDTQYTSPLPSYIESSIAYKKSHYARNIIELLSFVAPRSNTLQEIRLSYILFRREHIERLATIISSSKSIKSLVLFHIPLGNEKIRALLNGLNPNNIKHITIISCDINGACIEDILRFIRRRMDKENGIQSFEVGSSEFCDADRRRIVAALSNCEPEEIVGAYQKSNQINNNNKSIFTNTNEYNEVNKESIENIPEIQDNGDDVARRNLIQKLEEENQQLEAQIRSLTEMVNAEKIGSTLYAAGPGSKRLISYLNKLEQQLQELDKTPREYP